MDPDATGYLGIVRSEFPKKAFIIDQVSYPVNESMHQIERYAPSRCGPLQL
jgi:hypothetical protein